MNDKNLLRFILSELRKRGWLRKHSDGYWRLSDSLAFELDLNEEVRDNE